MKWCKHDLIQPKQQKFLMIRKGIMLNIRDLRLLLEEIPQLFKEGIVKWK